MRKFIVLVTGGAFNVAARNVAAAKHAARQLNASPNRGALLKEDALNRIARLGYDGEIITL